MIKIKSILIWVILSIALAACTALTPLKPLEQCLPNFPDRDGWYGGDGAYSVQLDNHRTMWLFGDTFVSDDIGRKDRIGMDVVMGNTLAVSTCPADRKFSIRYFLKKKNSTFVPFFGENEILWPQDPFIVNGTLFIPLLLIETLPDAPAPFNFKIAGHKIARVKDFSDADPRKWPVNYMDWTSSIPSGIEALATTSIVHEHYVYFFPLYRYRKAPAEIHGNILARIPVNNLEHPTGAFEYLHRDGTWRKELLHDTVKIIFSAPVSELSVRYHRLDQKWLAVYLSPFDGGRKLLIQAAKTLEGPWSAPEPAIESIPELDPSTPLYNRYTFCYAGKEHRQLARDKNLVVTYVCNSSEDQNRPSGFLRNNLFLYRPVVKNVVCPSNICH